jgi:hypothetical protein
MSNNATDLSKQHHQENLVNKLQPTSSYPTDTNAEALQIELKHQALELHNDSNEKETLQWLEAIADTKNWT